MAEDFIPLLPETETPDEPILRLSRRRLKPRIIPDFCTSNSSGKADGGSVPRSHHKRSRDASADDHLSGNGFLVGHNPHKMRKASPFLGHEEAFYTQRRESEIGRLIMQQTLDFARKLKDKDEEIARMGKLNRMLQEKLKSLATETQIWRGLAQDNEAEADALRTNLVLVLARGDGVDDAESRCGSNDSRTSCAEGGDAATAKSLRRRPGCGERESGLVLLPCRPSDRDCPECGSAARGSVHVSLPSPS